MTATPVDKQKKAAYTRPEMTSLQLVLDDVFLMGLSEATPASCPQQLITGETFGLDDF